MIKGYSEGQGNVVGMQINSGDNCGYYIVQRAYKPSYQVRLALQVIALR